MDKELIKEKIDIGFQLLDGFDLEIIDRKYALCLTELTNILRVIKRELSYLSKEEEKIPIEPEVIDFDYDEYSKGMYELKTRCGNEVNYTTKINNEDFPFVFVMKVKNAPDKILHTTKNGKTTPVLGQHPYDVQMYLKELYVNLYGVWDEEKETWYDIVCSQPLEKDFAFIVNKYAPVIGESVKTKIKTIQIR
jgi:hypothetical protein